MSQAQSGSASAADPAPVTVRYWAAAREAAGVESEVIAAPVGADVAAVLDLARASRPALAPVLTAASILADGVRVDADRAVAPGTVLEVLPPFAGG